MTNANVVAAESETGSRPPIEPLVLVAADDESSRQEVGRRLERFGTPVAWVKDGPSALDALARVSYALVLMDCRIAERDEFRIVAELRRRESAEARTPLIALADGDLAAARERCLACGMDGCVARGLPPADLARILEEWMAPVARSALDELLELAGSAEEFGRLRTQFLAHAEDCLRDISARAQAGDTSGVADAAHALKGSSGAFGARRLSALCGRLEAAGRAGRSADTAALAPAATVEFARVRAALLSPELLKAASA